MLIRHIQNFRKESNLKVQDRIEISVESSEKIIDAIKENEDYFKNEILAVSFSSKVLNSQYLKEFMLEAESVKIGIKISG